MPVTGASVAVVAALAAARYKARQTPPGASRPPQKLALKEDEDHGP